MLVQSYAPPIPTSITAKSTLTKNSYLDSEEVAFSAAWCRQQLAYLLLKKHVEGQNGEETEVCRHCSSVGVLQKREQSSTREDWKSTLDATLKRWREHRETVGHSSPAIRVVGSIPAPVAGAMRVKASHWWPAVSVWIITCRLPAFPSAPQALNPGAQTAHTLCRLHTFSVSSLCDAPLPVDTIDASFVIKVVGNLVADALLWNQTATRNWRFKISRLEMISPANKVLLFKEWPRLPKHYFDPW